MPRRYVCPKCQNQVKDKCKEDAIECEICRKWYHFSCSDLTDQQFKILCNETSLEWNCAKCLENECAKCERTFRYEKRIICSLCTSEYHPRCQNLNFKSCEKIDLSNWLCIYCKDIIFPFNSITPDKIEALSFNSICPGKHYFEFRHIHQKSKNIRFSPKSNIAKKCKVCSKTISRIDKAIPCPSCTQFIQRSCSGLNQSQIINFKRSKNIWECPLCTNEKYPFMNIDNEDLLLSSYNSNWDCKCKEKKVKSKMDEVVHQQKLILNYKYDTSDSLYRSPGDEFDLEFE